MARAQHRQRRRLWRRHKSRFPADSSAENGGGAMILLMGGMLIIILAVVLSVVGTFVSSAAIADEL